MEPTVITDSWATLILNGFKVLAIFFWNSLKIWQSDKTSTGLRLVCRNSATCVIQCCYSICCSSDSWSDSFTTDVELSSWWQQGNGSFVACYLKQWTLNDWMGLHDPNICLSCTVYMYSTETWLAQLNKVLCCFVVRARLSFGELLHCVTLKDKLRRLSCRSKKVELSLFMLIGQLLHYPCKIFTEISSRLMRSHWECRDLAEISPWCLLDSKSRRDIFHLAEIAENSPRLPRSQISSSSWRDFLHLAEIGKISPWNLTLSVSCQDFEKHKLLTEIAKI